MRMLGMTCVALAGLFLFVGCSGDEEKTVVTTTDDVTVDQGQRGRVSVGKFVFHVVPDCPNGPQITVEPLVDEGYPGQDGNTIQQGLTSVLSDCSVVGPGSWNPSTHTISATVRITNEHTSDFDEPIMQVLWITPDGVNVTFQQTHGGGTGVGAWYAYADIEEPPGENGSSAKQNMSIYDPEDLPFSFAVDVLAELGSPSSEIFGDADDDRFNEEIDEDAGDDCDDADASIYPGGGGCLCWGGCSGGCPSGYDCCEETCTSSCSVNCPEVSCACYFYPSSGDDLHATCDQGTTCYVESNGGANVDVEHCDTGTCGIDCVDSSDCYMNLCNAGADCDIACNNSTNCKVTECQDGADCDIACVDSGDCMVDECHDTADCSVSCDGDTNCHIEKCYDWTTCNLSCSNSDDDCKISECKDDSVCNVSCDNVDKCVIDKCEQSSCTIDCANTEYCFLKCEDQAECVLDCDNVDSCVMDCAQTLIECPGDVFVCGDDPVCP